MMIQFWMAVALLCLLASAFVVVPLMRSTSRARGRSSSLDDHEDDSAEGQDRATLNVALYEERLADLEASLAGGDIDADTFEQLKREQQQALLADADQVTGAGSTATDAPAGRAPWLAALLIPLLAVWAYGDFGLGWGAIADEQLARELQTPGRDLDEISASVENLARRLQNQPDNDEGWFLLGQSFMRLGEFERAAQAFAHLVSRYPDDASLATRQAEMLFLADDRQLTPRVTLAIDQTLALDPNNIAMLEIKAMDAFNRRDLAGALDWFRKALAAGVEGDRAELIRQAVARLESDLDLAASDSPADAAAADAAPADAAPADAAAADAAAAQSPSGSGRQLQVLVELAPSVSAPADARVFVFARALAGPPMPLAVKALSMADLPQLVTLDESMAMMPGMGLANFDQVQLVARISSSGIANASPDDYEAQSTPIDLTVDNSVVVLTLAQRIRDQ